MRWACRFSREMMHLEESRYARYRESEGFLAGNDAVVAGERHAA
jgi:hypothetical protein